MDMVECTQLQFRFDNHNHIVGARTLMLYVSTFHVALRLFLNV